MSDVPTRSALHTLPVELWKQILRLATLPSPQFEASAQAAFGWQFSGNPDPLSLSTKLAIALTCKYLWNTVSDFLYETIILSKASDAQGILDRIAKDDRLQSGLDVELKVHVLILSPTHSDEDVDAYGSTCARLIPLCQNVVSIKILSPFLFRPWMHSHWIAGAASGQVLLRQSQSIFTLLSRLRTNNIIHLQELDVHIDFRVTLPGGVTFIDILKEVAPSLRRLRLVGPMYRAMEGATISFPNLTHLAIMRLPEGRSNVSRIMKTWTFDSITHFYIDSYMNDDNIERFWRTPRPNIVFLHLGRSLMVARTITNATPNLEVLELVYTRMWGDIWESSPESYQLPKTLKHVAVQTYLTLEADDSELFNFFARPSNASIESEKLKDLASHIQPFVNPRLVSLESFTVRISLGHWKLPRAELDGAVRRISQVLGPGVSLIDIDSEMS